MSYCGEGSIVKRDRERALAITLRCRSWRCEHCADVRKSQLVALGAGGEPTLFVTLTSRRREGKSADDAAKQLAWAWRVARKRLHRLLGVKSVPFLCVIERHRSGWPHLHLLIRYPFIPQEILSRWMRDLCDGPNVWIEKIKSIGDVARYAAKYISKDPHRFAHTPRYWRSRDYDLREPQPDSFASLIEGPYSVTRESLNDLIYIWTRASYVLEIVRDGRVEGVRSVENRYALARQREGPG